MPRGTMVQVPFGHTRVNRLLPVLGAQFYKSYSLRRPLVTHWRPATCEEADCAAWRHGWATLVDTSSELGQRRYHFITHDRTRRYTVEHAGEGLFRFTFGPGQTCYAADRHRVPVSRPPLFVVTGGDWRGNPRGTQPVVHRSADDWADDFSSHQERLARAQR